MIASVLAWLFLGVVWGTTWTAIKMGLADLPPLSFAGLRFSVAALVLLLVLLVRRGPWLPRGRVEWGLVGGTALVTISFQYALQFWAQQYVASGLASVLTATIPIFVMVFAHWSLPSEPMTRRKVAGMLLGLSGVVVIFSDQLHSAGLLAFWGSIALVVGAAASSRAQVYVKKSGGGIDPMIMAGWQMGIGSAPLLTLGFVLDGPPTALHWTRAAVLSLTYLSCVGSAMGFLVMYWLFRRMDVTKVLSVAFVNPLVAVFAGWMVLDEMLSWRAILGGFGILFGLGLVLRTRRESDNDRRMVISASPPPSGGP
jgi:drug/metabolite transporter (DMT)-like permease